MLEAHNLGVRIGKIKKEILQLPLESLNRQVNNWETVTPLIDPTEYIKHRTRMDIFSELVEILLVTQHKLQKLVEKERKN